MRRVFNGFRFSFGKAGEALAACFASLEGNAMLGGGRSADDAHARNREVDPDSRIELWAVGDLESNASRFGGRPSEGPERGSSKITLPIAFLCGELGERLKPAVLKTVVPERVPGVRIPRSPP